MSKLLLMNNVAVIEEDLNYFCMYSKNFDKVPEKYRWNRIYQYNGNEIKEMYNIPPNVIRLSGGTGYYPSSTNYEKYSGSIKRSDDGLYYGYSPDETPNLDQMLRIENLKYNDNIYIKLMGYKMGNSSSSNGRMYWKLYGEDGKLYKSNRIDDICYSYSSAKIVNINLNDYNLDSTQTYKFYFYFLGYTGSAISGYFALLELWVNYDNYLASIQ